MTDQTDSENIDRDIAGLLMRIELMLDGDTARWVTVPEIARFSRTGDMRDIRRAVDETLEQGYLETEFRQACDRYRITPTGAALLDSLDDE